MAVSLTKLKVLRISKELIDSTKFPNRDCSVIWYGLTRLITMKVLVRELWCLTKLEVVLISLAISYPRISWIGIN